MHNTSTLSRIQSDAVSHELYTQASDLRSLSHATALQLFRELNSKGPPPTRQVYFSPICLTENLPLAYKKSNSLESPMWHN